MPTSNTSTINRRDFLGVAAGGSTALTAALLGSPTVAGAQPRKDNLNLEVAITTLDTVRTTPSPNFPTGPFYVQGSLYAEGTLNADGTVPEGAKAVGTFRCWGWIFDGATFGAAVSQAYELDDVGTLYTHGREGAEKRAITGGTDRFKRARGEANVAFINPANFSFRASFDIH